MSSKNENGPTHERIRPVEIEILDGESRPGVLPAVTVSEVPVPAVAATPAVTELIVCAVPCTIPELGLGKAEVEARATEAVPAAVRSAVTTAIPSVPAMSTTPTVSTPPTVAAISSRSTVRHGRTRKTSHTESRN